MTAIRLEVVVECPNWDALDEWHLRENLPIPIERLEYLIERSHVSACEYEFVTSTVPPAVRDDWSNAGAHRRPGVPSVRPSS